MKNFRFYVAAVLVVLTIFLLLATFTSSGAEHATTSQGPYHYIGKSVKGKLSVSLDPAGRSIVVIDVGRPAEFCAEKTESFCIRSDELYLEIPRGLVPKSNATWLRGGVQHKYGGVRAVDFRGREILVHQILSSRPNFGLVEFLISSTHGLIGFTVTMQGVIATYELAPDLAKGLNIFEGRGSEQWNTLKK